MTRKPWESEHAYGELGPEHCLALAGAPPDYRVVVRYMDGSRAVWSGPVLAATYPAVRNRIRDVWPVAGPA